MREILNAESMIINVSWETFLNFFSQEHAKNVDLYEFIIYFSYFVKKKNFLILEIFETHPRFVSPDSNVFNICLSYENEIFLER